MHSNHLDQLRQCCQDDAAFERLKQILQSAEFSVESDSFLVEQHKAVVRVIARIRETLDLDTIFNVTATEVRQLLNADRVGVFRFDPNSGYDDGEFVSEDVLPGFHSALAAKIHDHCFGEQYAIHYQHGKIQAVSDIHNAGLRDCHIQVLSQFQIWANLIVPLLQGDRLWGLLCIHQCARPRHWQESEIEFVTQIAAQLGVALQQAELLAQIQAQAEQQKTLFNVITRIRESLELDTIFNVTATEVRQLLNADRVGIFRFDSTSDYDDGEFVSEDVLPEFPSALTAKIHDHCFGEQYAIHYQHGKLQAVSDIYHAGLRDCHIQVLSQFQIRANLIVPLLQGDRLWGLLCIHQCAHPRHWQETEIEFVTQIAAQLGVALQQAELLLKTQQQSTELAQTLDRLKNTQTQLIQNEKMSSLGQLVAGIAHEINNPVNFIYGNLVHARRYTTDLMELLALYQHSCPDPHGQLSDRLDEIDLDFLIEDLPKILSSMHMGADRIRQIVLSLRNFTRLDEALMKSVDIHEGIESTLLILQYRLKPKARSWFIDVVKDYGDLPLVECYPSQLNQVFMNILSNAIDAVEEHHETLKQALDPEIATLEDSPTPTITIHTSCLATESDGVARVAICISDNGMGISDTVQAKLFDPFFTTKPVGKGTGLGLSISYQIVVERHGGRLRCQSQVGQGTDFWIEIPLQQAQSAVVAHAPQSLPSV